MVEFGPAEHVVSYLCPGCEMIVRVNALSSESASVGGRTPFVICGIPDSEDLANVLRSSPCRFERAWSVSGVLPESFIRWR